MKPPNTQVAQRVDISPVVEREIWGRSAGRCAMCGNSLFGQTPYYDSTLTGQIAHNVGATSGPKSPRGQSPLDGDERAAASNLILLCYSCHREVDDKKKLELYNVQLLADLKQAHEVRVAKSTDFSNLRPVVVLVIDGRLRATDFDIKWKSVVPALLSSGLRTAINTGSLCHDHRTLTDDQFRSYALEHGLDEIELSISKTREWLKIEEIQGVAVFALATVPLLVSLGAKLDDLDNVWIYQKQRDSDQPWEWRLEGSNTFSLDIIDRDLDALDVLAIISVSGSVDETSLSPELSSMPKFVISSAVISPEAIVSEVELARFKTTWLQGLGKVESEFPKCLRLHVIAAVPNSAAIKMGQSRMRSVHPEFIVYQREDEGSYVPMVRIRDGVQEEYNR